MRHGDQGGVTRGSFAGSRIRWDALPEGLMPPGEGQVHVFAADLDLARAGKAFLPSWLSPDEQERASRFHFERDRRRFMAARGLLRGLLGRYCEREPSTLRFAYGPRGKPSLLAPAGSLRFNLSHSGGLALFAFVREVELGVDLEQERPVPEAASIAERYFSRRENADLRSLAEPERSRAFFRCWTRKEAFIKATGDGLSRSLDAFDVTLAPGEPARLVRVEGEPALAGRFWLQDLEVSAGFAAALASEGRPRRVACWTVGSSEEERHGSRRGGRQDDLQGGAESRGAVLDLAG